MSAVLIAQRFKFLYSFKYKRLYGRSILFRHENILRRQLTFKGLVLNRLVDKSSKTVLTNFYVRMTSKMAAVAKIKDFREHVIKIQRSRERIVANRIVFREYLLNKIHDEMEFLIRYYTKKDTRKSARVLKELLRVENNNNEEVKPSLFDI